jgi:hypothetical protein
MRIFVLQLILDCEIGECVPSSVMKFNFEKVGSQGNR